MEILESLSSMSSSTSLLPSPGVSLSSVPSASGNLLSNVQPPSALPSFVMTPQVQQSSLATSITPTQSVTQGPSVVSGLPQPQPSPVAPMPYATADTFCPTQFR